MRKKNNKISFKIGGDFDTNLDIWQTNIIFTILRQKPNKSQIFQKVRAEIELFGEKNKHKKILQVKHYYLKKTISWISRKIWNDAVF